MGRWLLGMELSRARAAAASDPVVRAEALRRAGDAYERARAAARGPDGEAAKPGAAERLWRGLGRALAALLAPAPGVRERLEHGLLAPLGRAAPPS